MRNGYKTDVSIRPFILPFSASPKGRKKERRKEGLLVAACQHGYHSVLAAGCLYTYAYGCVPGHAHERFPRV